MRRALRPLGRLDAAAAEIERTGDPRRRLPEPETDDEVGRLATTLNAMLAALERAREAERRFLADASHELRTPLTALRGNVAYLARHGASAELVAELEDDAARLARLADDLLALSREDAAAPPDEVVRLDELARGAVAGADVDGRAPSPVAVRGDGPRSSARSRTWSRTRAATGAAPDHGRGAGRTTASRRSRVSDEGPGLPRPEAEHAFERFWRGDGGRAGLGPRARDRARDGRAPRRPRLRRRARASRSSCRLVRELSESGGYNGRRGARERIAVKLPAHDSRPAA